MTSSVLQVTNGIISTEQRLAMRSKAIHEFVIYFLNIDLDYLKGQHLQLQEMLIPRSLHVI